MSITNDAHDNSAESKPRSSDQFLDATVDTTPGGTSPISHEGGHERAARRSLRSVFRRRQHDNATKGSFVIENSVVDIFDDIAGYVRFTTAKKTIRRD
jgi:hypothetical protein